MRNSTALIVIKLMSLVGLTLAFEADARACGGCFHQTEATVVNDHRMVFAISQKHTILWDQIEYSGNPKEFAWVLPVARGTVVELSRDEWIAALDSTTQPRIQSPPQSSGGIGDDGCDGLGCSSTTTEDFGASSSGGGAEAPPAVAVVAQSVVGPYETVTLRSEDPQALQGWLRDHGYTLPPTIEPVIAAYSSKGLDFIALRLRPGEGVRAMRPVRIVTPGADLTLPLRMVAAGAGANVGLTLYVLAEGRYRPQNFPEVAIDDSKLVWRTAESRSNYQELSLATMAAAPGQRGWLVEWANRVSVGRPGSGNAPSGGALADTYYARCSDVAYPSPGPSDPSGGDDPDAGASELDASADAADAGDAATHSGTSESDAGESTSPPCQGTSYCCAYDDLDLAIDGMSESDVWVTRLRANLPLTALSDDLRLEAHPTQEVVSGLYVARPDAGTTASIAPLNRGRTAGSATLTLGVVFAVTRLLRRRRPSKSWNHES